MVAAASPPGADGSNMHCPLGDGLQPGGIAVLWLQKRPPAEVFPAAADPWLCAATHAAALQQARAALTLTAMLLLLTLWLEVSEELAGSLLCVWTVAGVAAHLLRFSRHAGAAAWLLSGAQLAVGVSSLTLAVWLKLPDAVRGRGAARVVESTGGPSDTGAAGGVWAGPSLDAGPLDWLAPLAGALGGTAPPPPQARPELQLTDSLQAAFERQEAAIHRAYLDQAESAPSRAAVRFSPLQPGASRRYM